MNCDDFDDLFPNLTCDANSAQGLDGIQPSIVTTDPNASVFITVPEMGSEAAPGSLSYREDVNNDRGSQGIQPVNDGFEDERALRILAIARWLQSHNTSGPMDSPAGRSGYNPGSSGEAKFGAGARNVYDDKCEKAEPEKAVMSFEGFGAVADVDCINKYDRTGNVGANERHVPFSTPGVFSDTEYASGRKMNFDGVRAISQPLHAASTGSQLPVHYSGGGRWRKAASGPFHCPFCGFYDPPKKGTHRDSKKHKREREDALENFFYFLLCLPIAGIRGYDRNVKYKDLFLQSEASSMRKAATGNGGPEPKQSEPKQSAFHQ